MTSKPKCCFRRVGWVVLALVGSGCVRDIPELNVPGEGSTLTGQVFTTSPDTGRLEPVTDARIEARGTSFRARTDERGAFSLPRLPLGRYDIVVEQLRTLGSALARKLSGVSLEVDGQALDLGEIRLGAPGILEGEVILRGSNADLFPVGTLITAAGTAFRGFTDERGRWRVAGLPEGSYDLMAVRPGFSVGRRTEIPVLPEIELGVRPFILQATSEGVMHTVTGTVSDPDGTPLDSVMVTVFEGIEERATAPSDSGGNYTVDLSAGAYRFRFERDGFVPAELRGVVVFAGASFGLTPIVLGPAAGDADGDGIPDAEDDDADNDGIPNEEDTNPLDPTRSRDSDGDGIPDEIDVDQDGDTLVDEEELTRGDDGWFTNPEDPDTDGDSVRDDRDLCPTVPDPDQSDRDGDGRGDACENLGPQGQVFGMEPATAGIGDFVEIRGAGFPLASAEAAVRFGDAGLPVPPAAASESTLVVPVPERSETGTVTVFLPEGTLTVPEPFCFHPRPQIDEVQTRRPVPGEAVDLIGLGFTSPECITDPSPLELVFTASVSGTVRASLSGGGVDRILVGQVFRDRARFIIPEGAVSGPIYLARGRIQSPTVDWDVDGGPIRITSVEPSAVAPGDLIRINGQGFLSGGGLLEITFPGGTTVETFPSTDTEVFLPVPADITDGDLILQAGTATARARLTLRSQAVRITSFEPSVARPGQTTLIVRGENLESVERVRFAGASSAVVDVNPTDSQQFSIRVPADAGPGPITLETSHGNLTSNERLAIATTDVRSVALVIDAGFVATRNSGDRLILFSRDQYRIDRHGSSDLRTDLSLRYQHHFRPISSRRKHRRDVVRIRGLSMPNTSARVGRSSGERGGLFGVKERRRSGCPIRSACEGRIHLGSAITHRLSSALLAAALFASNV